MKFKVKLLGIDAGGKPIIIMDDEYASLLGIHSSDRVEITYKKESATDNANFHFSNADIWPDKPR